MSVTGGHERNPDQGGVILKRRVARVIVSGLFLLIGANGNRAVFSAEAPARSVKMLLFALPGGNIAAVQLPSWQVNIVGDEIAKIAYPVGIKVFAKTSRGVALYVSATMVNLIMFDLKDEKAVDLRECAGLSPKASLLQAYIATNGEHVVIGTFSELHSFLDLNSELVPQDQIYQHVFKATLDIEKVGPNEGSWQKTEQQKECQSFTDGIPSFDRLRQEVAQKQLEGEEGLPKWDGIYVSLKAQRKQLSETLISKNRLDSDHPAASFGVPPLPDTILYWDSTFIVCRHEDRFLLVANDGEDYRILSRSPIDFGKQDGRLLTPGAVDIIVE